MLKGVEPARRRVLVIGLDGYELSLAETMMAEGNLPNIARIRAAGARLRLDHGRDKYSGLSWEHFSTGLAPSDGGRWSAVTFDPRTYGIWQESTSATPFVANIRARTVVFDLPYCDLSLAPEVRGVTNWGAHDPGVSTAARPTTLLDELRERFGPYPAGEWIYGFSWPSVEKTRKLGDALANAVKIRAQAARWTLSQRIKDWDLGIVVVAECHSAIEPLWHGMDSAHPLHHIVSTAAAAEGVRKVYRAIDDLVGDLSNTFPDATVVILSMHGMGPNTADVPSMALLPELLYRYEFGRSHMQPTPWPRQLPDGTPLLDEETTWDQAMHQAVSPVSAEKQSWLSRLIRPIAGSNPPGSAGIPPNGPNTMSIDWMPAARYQRFWRRMKAFALPAFYDGRVRVNLQGRESRGKVRKSEYREFCRRLVELLHECRNAQTGEPIVDEIYWDEKDPMNLRPSEADLYILWRGAPLGLTHDTLGTIGPLPYRRTGGHTGKHGFLFVQGRGIVNLDAGTASSFDVVPTIIDLIGTPARNPISGRSILSRLRMPHSDQSAS